MISAMTSSASGHVDSKRGLRPRISTRVQASVQISVALPLGGGVVGGVLLRRASGGQYSYGVFRYCGGGPAAR